MSKYAATTEVSSERSRSEIERTLSRYGAEQFMYGWDRSAALVGFVAHHRQVRFRAAAAGPQRTRVHAHAHARHATVRSTGRNDVRAGCPATLALVIKAKLEAVEAGIVTFKDEFAMHVVLPDGKQVRDHVPPAIEQSYRDGTVAPMLAIEP